jgi:Zn-finger nucleic acid-binding protein
MAQTTVGGADIGECPQCRGLWFDQGELETVKDEVLPEIGWLDIEAWKAQAEFRVQLDPKFCPKCRVIALTCVIDARSGTQLYMCAQCRGVWLPTGQFLNLVNALLEEANQKSAPEYARICLQQAKEMLVGDAPMISDWQDLKHVLRMLKHRIFIDHPKLKSLLVGMQKSLPL